MPPKWKRNEAIWKIAEIVFTSVVGPIFVALLLTGAVRDEVDRMVDLQLKMQQNQTMNVNINQNLPVRVTEAVEEIASQYYKEDIEKMSVAMSSNPKKRRATPREVFNARVPMLREKVKEDLLKQFPDNAQQVDLAVDSYIEGQKISLTSQYITALSLASNEEKDK